MIYLLLAILCSTSITLIMRCAKGRVQNDYAMYLGNYMICSLMAVFFIGGVHLYAHDMGAAVWLGVISGAFYLTNLVLQNVNIQRNGVTLASTFGKLGVAVSTLIAVVVFREAFSISQAAGFVLAIVAIVLMNFEKTEQKNTAGLLLIVFLISTGLTDSMTNFYDKIGNPLFKDQFLFYNFFAAMIFCLLVMLKKHEKMKATDFLWGAAFGVPNYLSTRFLLWALGSIPASLAYPIFSVSSMLILVLCGGLVFHEEINLRKKASIGVILVSLILLNI